MSRSRALRILDWLSSRHFVGCDPRGNRYFLEHASPHTPGAAGGPRRVVEYAGGAPGARGGGSAHPDVHSVPIEWWSWLRYTREAPPSDEEVARGEEDARRRRERVRQIEEVDEKMRVRELAARADAPGMRGGVDDDMQRTLRIAMGRNRSELGSSHKSTSTAPEPVDHFHKASPEAQGSGDTFVPGAWRPTKGRGRRRGT